MSAPDPPPTPPGPGDGSGLDPLIDPPTDPLIDPPTDPLMDVAVDALRALILAAQEFRQAVAARLGVGVTDTLAMSYLATDGALGARELGDRMGIATSSVTTVLDRLESHGLARRERLPDDRRGLAIVLTDHGHEALGWTRRWMRRALSDVGDDRLGDLTDILASLATSLRAQIDPLGSSDFPAPSSRPPSSR